MTTWCALWTSGSISHRLHGKSEDAGIELPRSMKMDEAMAFYARKVLDENKGNRSATARVLGIGHNRLSRLLDL